ncbi:putative damage-inducible protein DinB [Salirhabdus euzebyi]|uniref:Putative damage-inducible protein DinB n=1 Tax=Salirhabdus euzebyi TaxID=394506 RepID=A0A841Q705_9BACI|nr:DinB family protein [Salirhabdus euzebyi]MBB6454133.1 putative damage-inducible protein DinB [Salirhabdus euzebyi]
MSELFNVRDHLLDELYVAVRTSKKLIIKIEQKDWNYRPKENMRSLIEVTHHLVSIPLADLKCLLQEKSEDEYKLIEQQVAPIRETEQLAQVFEHNYQTLKDYFHSMNEDDLMNKVTKPFYYQEGGYVQIKWLMEILTHTFHHRAQLFNYLKELEYDVNMFDLY